MVVAKLRARLAVDHNKKLIAGRESFNIAKLKVKSERVKYQIEIRNRFQALAVADPL